MALTNKKTTVPKKVSKKRENTSAKKSAPARAPKEVKKHAHNDGRFEGVLRRPWLSEKSIYAMEKGVYVFEVTARASAKEVMKAVQYAYGVSPVKVNIVHLPAKKKPLRNARGFGLRARRHKAYVYLAKGDTIQF